MKVVIFARVCVKCRKAHHRAIPLLGCGRPADNGAMSGTCYECQRESWRNLPWWQGHLDRQRQYWAMAAPGSAYPPGLD